jgi:Glucose / Sorbosone dehydrogenase
LRESSGEFKRDQGCVLGVDTPTIPFWHLLFKNIRLDFLGSDDFPPEEKTKAALAILPGRNYGYPIVSDGDHYDDKPIPNHDTRP